MIQQIYNPDVSIIIPVYNGANYLREAIDSALSQTYPNCEVLVINDGSTDGGTTEAIAKSYGDQVRYYLKPNGGVSSALNLGIQHMRGEYFSWLSHDDVYMPQKIETQVSMLGVASDKNVIVLCRHLLVNKVLHPLARQPRSALKNCDILTGEKALEALLRRGTFNGCALLIPKTAFDICGGFDESLRFNQDSYMWYRLFLAGYSLVYSDFVGVKQRTHEGQLTQTGQTAFRADCAYMSTQLIPSFIEYKQRSTRLLYWYMVHNAVFGHMEIVQKCLVSGLDARVLGPSDKIIADIVLKYGRVRPRLKRIYYAMVFKRLKS